MAFKSREMMKKIMKKIGGESNLAPGVKESLEKCIPKTKIVMGRAQRGLFAGRHIQFGNRVSEDGGNKKAKLCQSIGKEPVEGKRMEDHYNIEFEERERERCADCPEFELAVYGSISGIFQSSVLLHPRTIRNFTRPKLGPVEWSVFADYGTDLGYGPTVPGLMRVNQAATKLSGRRSFCSL